MRVTARRLRLLCLSVSAIVAVMGSAACWGTPTPEAPGRPFQIALVTDKASPDPHIRITGWSSQELASLEVPDWTPESWERLVRVSVGRDNTIAMSARYQVSAQGVDIIPTYPLERGQAYVVTLDSTALPVPRATGILTKSLVLPVSTAPPATFVEAIAPSASVWPENLLRFYLHFSEPMSGTSAVGHVSLVDEAGVTINDALLEVDVDLWSGDYTRRTVFFDPGRVKQGVKPNVDGGRALVVGRKYAIVVNTSWHDAEGRPLVRPFTHHFTAGPSIAKPIDPDRWTLSTPAAGSREPLVVTFPWALDEGLLHRAIGVTTGDAIPLNGEIETADEERAWRFTPAQPWRAIPHALAVLTILEDPSGNKVGQAFEFDMFNQPMPTERERVTRPFRPR